MKSLFLIIFCVALLAGCQDENLQQGNWNLKTMFDQDVSGLQKPITISFNPEKHSVAGFAGCNQYFGTFASDKTALTVKGTGGTKMFCQETMATELKFMTALEQVESFKIKGNSLLLLTDDKIILEFTK